MKQHIVSKCYLKAWCDPSTPKGHEPYIWLISRDGLVKNRRAPQKSLTKSDAYTIKFPDGKKDLKIEITLSQLESMFVRVRQKITERKSIDSFERAALAAFMATMHSRTDPFADAMKENWTAIDEMVKHAERAIKDGIKPTYMGIARPGEGVPVSSADTEFMIANARAFSVKGALDTAAPIIWRMNFAFLRAPKDAYFITSDNPCVWLNPDAYRLPPLYRGAGLAMKDIEITMPLSPEVLVLLTHKPEMQGQFVINDRIVDNLNRRIIAFCDEKFVSKSPDVRPSWFEHPPLPDDAWENRNKSEERRTPLGEIITPDSSSSLVPPSPLHSEQ